MEKFNLRLVNCLVSTGVLFAGNSFAQSDFLLEEVVVTAQKREQSAQDVGIAVTAFDGNALAQLGVNEPIDIAQHTPNLNVKNVLNKSAPIFTIRGIGNAAFTSNSVAPVGVYVDEIFLPTNSMMSFAVFDMDRVEVLKGPQGTLFGRNTTAGAVSFVTKRPSREGGDNYVRLGLGNYSSFDTEFGHDFVLSEALAARISGKWSAQGEGTFTNRIDGRSEDVGTVNTWALRAGFLFEFDSGDAYLNLHGGKDRSENEPWVGIGRSALDNPTGPAPELPGIGGLQYRNSCLSRNDNGINAFINNPNCVNRVGYYDPYTDPRVGEFSVTPRIESDALGAILNVNVDLGGDILFTSITALETLDKTTEEDFDGSPYRIGDTSYKNDIEVFSQELRLSSGDPLWGSVDWIAGVMYYQDEQQVQDLYGYTDRVNHDVLVEFVQDTVSYAGYLHTETTLSERLKLIAGLRVTRDEIAFDGGTRVVNLDSDFTGDVTFFDVANTLVTNDEVTTTEATYKVGLDYAFGEDMLLYGNYSRGYKAGVWNGFWTYVEGDHNSTSPEFIDAYEVGFKSTLVEGRLRLNAAMYYYDYTDMQLFADFPDGSFRVINAGTADVKGAEVEINWLLTRSFELRGGIGYTDASISGEVGIDTFDDAVPPNTPELTYNLLGRYTHDLSSGGSVFFQADYAWQDDVYFSLYNQKAISEESYGLLGLRAGYDSPAGWSANFWVKNATDELYFSEILTSGSAGVVSGQVGAPRTYGATLKLEL